MAIGFGGGLIQLVAIGSQDAHLTGTPQVTFFKTVHRRHTNFAMETIINTFSGPVRFGSTPTCTLSRNGDLVHKVYLQVRLPKFTSASQLADYNYLSNPVTGETIEYWPYYKSRTADVATALGNDAAEGDYWMSFDRWESIRQGTAKTSFATEADRGLGVWFKRGTFILAGDSTNEPVPQSVTKTDLVAFAGGTAQGTVLASMTLAAVPAAAKKQTSGDVVNGKVWGWCRKTGHALIKEVRVEIGGQLIDRHYGGWMDVWSQLSMSAEKANGYATMINEGATDYALQGKVDEQVTLYVPLQFWFCTNPGLSLPLIALQYHEVKINFDFRELRELMHIKHTDEDDKEWSKMGNVGRPGQLQESDLPGGTLEADLLVDYIYLDTEERKRFAMMTHEYLITQLQFTGIEAWNAENGRFRLNFNHPIKELVWTVTPDYAVEMFNEHFKYEDTATDRSLIENVKLQLNGHERFSERESSYFTLVQPFQHHTNVPMDAIHVYSFALKPEDIQPSGTCNFSRIDNATLIFSPSTENQERQKRMASTTLPIDGATENLTVNIWATNYNVLRIMSGMGGLAYAN